MHSAPRQGSRGAAVRSLLQDRDCWSIGQWFLNLGATELSRPDLTPSTKHMTVRRTCSKIVGSRVLLNLLPG